MLSAIILITAPEPIVFKKPESKILGINELSSIAISVEGPDQVSLILKYPIPGSVEVSVLSLYLQIASPPSIPDEPLVPDVPELPLDPDDPLVPDEPLVPSIPDVPLDPLTPEVPDEPDAPPPPLPAVIPVIEITSPSFLTKFNVLVPDM